MKNIDAKLLAIQAHSGQFRKTGGLPYYAHLFRVEELIIKYFSHREDFDVLRQVALLHDVLEDTWVTEEYLHANFSEDVVSMVCELTRPEGDKSVTVPLYKKTLSSASAGAQIIKVCDVYDNLCDTFEGDAWFKFVKKADSFLKVLSVDDKNFVLLKGLAKDEVAKYLS